LVPIYLGLCRTADLDQAHEAAGTLINTNLGMAVLVSVVHSIAMIAAGGLLAWLVYRYLGLKFVSRSWVNLDATWAFSLVLVRALSFAISLASRNLAAFCSDSDAFDEILELHGQPNEVDHSSALTIKQLHTEPPECPYTTTLTQWLVPSFDDA